MQGSGTSNAATPEALIVSSATRMARASLRIDRSLPLAPIVAVDSRSLRWRLWNNSDGNLLREPGRCRVAGLRGVESDRQCVSPRTAGYPSIQSDPDRTTPARHGDADLPIHEGTHILEKGCLHDAEVARLLGGGVQKQMDGDRAGLSRSTGEQLARTARLSRSAHGFTIAIPPNLPRDVRP